MIKARAQITLSYLIDITASYRYYLLQSSTSAKPSKPTEFPPPSKWDDTEPTYTDGSTNSLYYVDCTVFSDDTFAYSEVSLSSSYEAAKIAYNKAVNAENTANDAKDTANNMDIGGRNLIRNSAFMDGTNCWGGFGENVTLDTARTLNGHPSIKSAQTGLSGASWRGADNYYLPTYKGLEIKSGEIWTASMWYFVEDVSTFDELFVFAIKGFKANETWSTSIGSVSVSPGDIVEGKWTKVVVTFKASADHTSCFAAIYVKQNGTLWATDFKLEKGNKSTDWTPAPEDTYVSIDILNTSYSNLLLEQSNITATVQGHTTQIKEKADKSTVTSIQSQVTLLEADLTGFKTTVSSTYATQTDLSNLKIGGRNLIIRNTETINTWIDATGAVSTSGNHATSDYIAVEPGTEYMLSRSDSAKVAKSYFRWAWYGEDKTYIARLADAVNEILWEAPEGAYFARISYPTDCEVKFEKGNKATDFTPAPEDVDNEITSVRTIATQTADKFNWIVKSGTSSTDFTLTDRMAELTAEIISLNGNVKVSGEMIVDYSITASKINVADLFAQDITATGSITGVNLIGATGSFSGKITASEGEIAGWKVTTSRLLKENTESGLYVALCAPTQVGGSGNSSADVLICRTGTSSTGYSYPLVISSNGAVKVTDLTVTGGSISIGNNFKVSSTSIYLGGFYVDENSIYKGTWGQAGSVMFCTGTSTAKSIGGSPATVSGWTFTAGNSFGVTSAGAVYANNITIATGKIGGWNITSSCLEGPTGQTYLARLFPNGTTLSGYTCFLVIYKNNGGTPIGAITTGGWVSL